MERIAMSQEERDWLDWLKRARDGKMTQRQAAEQMRVSERWVRKLLAQMRREGDGVVVQWDTSDHDWLEGRGEGVRYLVRMLDDATSRSWGLPASGWRAERKAENGYLHRILDTIRTRYRRS